MGTPKFSREEMIAHQMMKGCNGKFNIKCEEGAKEHQEFCKQYAELLERLGHITQRSLSVGIPAAIGKGILWYGEEKMQPFCEAFKNRQYNGSKDPVLILREFLIRHPSRVSTDEVYRKTITAIRLYLRGSKTNYLKEAIDDLFEWEDNYTKMVQPKKNQHTKRSDKSIIRETSNYQAEQEVL